jgi:dTDP-4-amino-4,6-dideoxygalactose transaminase
MSFSASANCAVYVGAIPIFADIDKNTYNINPEEIKKQITPSTKIVIPVHYTGLPCNMEEIYDIVKYHDIPIIEDACHSLGAVYKNSNIGSCKYSDMNVFSFHPVKHITTGEGGMITTNSEELYNKLIKLRSHGIERRNDWFYDIKELGYNYRLTDFQCALGISQLDKLDDSLGKRRYIAYTYNENFKNLPIELPYDNINKYYHAYHLYVIRLKNNLQRARLYDYLKKNNIYTQVHYIPIHTFSYYKNMYGYQWGDYPNAENHYDRCLSLPIYPAMTEEDINKVMFYVKEFFKYE